MHKKYIYTVHFGGVFLRNYFEYGIASKNKWLYYLFYLIECKKIIVFLTSLLT